MNLFGFNITRRSAPAAPAKPAEHPISFDSRAWLLGEEAPPRGTDCTNAYTQVVWVYRAISVLAEQIANIPFLFSSGERGRENLITSGPLIDFYAAPHSTINSYEYWELRVLWLMLRGECMRIPIYRNDPSNSNGPPGRRGRRLRSVLLVDPSYFQEVVEGGRLQGWRYIGPLGELPLDNQVFLPEEVWFEKLPNPFNPWRGLPPLYVADIPAKTDYAAGAFMKGYLENNADNGLIVRTSEQLDETQRQQLLASLRRHKRSAGVADGPLLLWSSAEVVRPELSSADLQFLENRKFSRSEICAAFGVPEEIVASTDSAKYDVMQGARLNFIENRVAPLCARLEAHERATVKAIDPNAVGWFDLDSLPIMQAARRTRLATAKTGFDMGIPFNELNRVFDLGFKSLPWGNTGYLPSQPNPLGQIPEPPAPSSNHKPIPANPVDALSASLDKISAIQNDLTPHQKLQVLRQLNEAISGFAPTNESPPVQTSGPTPNSLKPAAANPPKELSPEEYLALLYRLHAIICGPTPASKPDAKPLALPPQQELSPVPEQLIRNDPPYPSLL